MTLTAWQIVAFSLSEIWRLFNSWYIPGTAMTPAGLLLLMAFATIVVRFWNKFTDVNSVNVDAATRGPRKK